MGNGGEPRGSGKWRVRGDFIAACLLLPVSCAFATDVGLSGLFRDKAVLVIDGKLRTVTVGGRTPEGVRLLSLEQEAAVVEVDGRRQRIGLASYAGSASSASAGGNEVILAADDAGHFLSVGSVNGAAVRFMVDTGATLVSIGAGDAQRIGLRYREGEAGYTMTANGRARVWKIKLDSVKLGTVELTNVDALVHEQSMPVVLLGMSFLNRMEMRRDGSMMSLRRRY